MAELNLTRREKRELGLLPRQLAWSMIGMHREGIPVKDTPPAELAVMLLADAQVDNPQAWAKVKADRDWESFFAALANFLETVVPIILQLIALFL